MQLTESQQQALNTLKAFTEIDNISTIDSLGNLSRSFFKLSGAAGTGKTFLTSQFLREYIEFYPTHKIAAVAPSHKARKNLAGQLEAAEVTLTIVTTVAAFLGMAPAIDDTTGKEVFVVQNGRNLSKPSPADYQLILVDEAWMLDEKTIQQITQVVNNKARVIFIGDCAQIPPIEDPISYLESFKTRHWPSVYLNEIVRYSGDLARIADTWRVNYVCDYDRVIKNNPVDPLPIVPTIDRSITQISPDDFIENFCSDIFSGKDARIIAYTNKRCAEWNREVRHALHERGFYKDASFNDYNINDTLIARKPISRKVDEKEETIFENSSEFKIIEVPKYEKMELCDERFFYWSVPVNRQALIGDGYFKLNILAEDSEKTFKNKLSQLAQTAKQSTVRGRWNSYYSLLRKFDDVTFNYAITCHKAQGSTLDAVYLDLFNLNKCPDKYQLIYTALTRSKQAYIY